MIWRSFRVNDERKFIYTNEADVKEISKKEWFNNSTDNIKIYIGYETEQYYTEPISDKMYLIDIEYHINNYFGDKNGFHFRTKTYVLYNGKLYKNESGLGKEAVRITKELKGILEWIKEN